MIKDKLKIGCIYRNMGRDRWEISEWEGDTYGRRDK